MQPVMPAWVVVGAGRCGLQLARALAAAGLDLRAVVTRSRRGRNRARRALPGVSTAGLGRGFPACDGLLIAVPDGSLGECAATIAPRLHPDTRIALHTSGLLPGGALQPLADRGCAVGSFHPLLSFPSATGPRIDLEGAVAAIEGAPAAFRAARALARALGMRPRTVTAADRPRYHAAAATAANLAHALVVAAADELTGIGFSRREAAAALAPLVRGSLAAALAAQAWRGLTGPLPRGDVQTVAAHLAALPPEVAAAYRTVAALAVSRLRRAKLLDRGTAERLLAALTGNSHVC